MKVLVLPLVAAVAAVPGPIAFRSLAQRAAPGEQPANPAVYLVTKAADLAPFADHLRAEDRTAARSVKLSERALVAVFLGKKPTGGFSVTVKRITVLNGRLTVTVDVRQPGPDSIVTQVFTSPYHLVTVARSALRPKLPIAWRLVDQRGRVLAAGASRP